MNNSINANAGKTVQNIVFCNNKMEIVCFKQFATPLPNNEVNPVQFINEPFKSAIVQFTDGSAYTFRVKKSANVKAA